jgi:hypothetical protein
MTSPAITRPGPSTSRPSVAARPMVSSPTPVSWAAPVKVTPSAAISSRLARVPRTAVEVRAENPWVR